VADAPDWTQQIAFQATQLANTIEGPGNSLTDLLIAQYSSLLLFEFADPAGTADSVISEHTQAFLTGKVFAADDFFATAELTNNNGFLALQCPVFGNYLTIKNWHPTRNARFVVYGTNVAPLGVRRWLGYAQLPRDLSTGNIIGGVAGTIYPMPILDLPAGATIPNQIAFNGSFSLNGNCSTAGTVYLYYLTPSNILTGIPVATFAAATNFNVTGYYEGFARVVWVPSVNGNTSCGCFALAGPPD
jgi:hypothetical protein